MKKIILLSTLLLAYYAAGAGNRIKCYFNKPVDTTVATHVNADYLPYCIADTMAAYIDRANYSLDICIYSFEKYITFSSSVLDTVCAPRVAAAINNAYTRGVKVRLIFDSGNANTGLSLLNAGIHTMGSPQSSGYTIMHNKFIIIDAKSPNVNDHVVWTGCQNWYYQQFDWDYNNVIIFQDSALAHAYTAEFNMMWGDTGINKNWALSRYGQYKTDLGLHDFYIDGTHVELYFSPSDGTDSHIQSTISSAEKDLYFGLYTFTRYGAADLIVAKHNSGLNVYGINDSYSNTYYPTGQFNTYLDTHFKVYHETSDSLYHNKMLIVDPSDSCGDPKVLTGSHNWSTSADTKNDENTVIVHNDTIANQYLQYFTANFNNLPGSAASIPAYNCIVPTGVTVVPATNDINIYPNPSTGNIAISYNLPSAQNVIIDIYNVTGIKTATLIDNEMQNAGGHTLSHAFETPGIYLIHAFIGGSSYTQKVLITK